MRTDAWRENLGTFHAMRGRTAAWRAIYAAVGTALAVILWFNFPRLPQVEFGMTHDFTTIMREIEQTGSFAHRGPAGRLEPETLREPLYPYALAAADWAFGYYGWLVPIQAAAIVAVCLTWFFVTWRLLGFPWAAILAALTCLNQPLFFYAAVLYPYAFNVLFLSTGLLFAGIMLRRRKLGWACAAGLMFALAVYERGSLELLPFFLGFCLWFFPAVVARRSIVALIATYALGVAPWLARNASHGIYGMHGLMGLTLGYTYSGAILAENDRTQADDPYGLRVKYLDLMRAEGVDAGNWDLLNLMRAQGRSNAEINRIFSYYVKQAIRRRPGMALQIVWGSLRDFPCRLLRFRTPLRDGSMWGYYVDNLYRTRPSAADWTAAALGALGFALMLFNREPVLLVMAPFMIYLVPIDTVLTIFDPRYRNGVFDLFELMLGLYALRFAWLAALRRDWRAGRIGWPPPGSGPAAHRVQDA